MINNEKVLVIHEDDIFGYNNSRKFDGFTPSSHFSGEIYRIIRTRGVYMDPSRIENNPKFKQVVPFALFRRDNKYLTYFRMGGETRLKGKSSIAIGGHVTAKDKGTFEASLALMRTFFEKVRYSPDAPLDYRFLGLLCSEETLVSKCHIGLAFLVNGKNGEIPEFNRENNTRIGMLSITELKHRRDQMDGWSQVLIDRGLSTLV